MEEIEQKLFLQVVNGQQTEKVPFWLMRQAGRYLPEYRELRTKAGSFLDMAYDPGKAAEVTVQPIRRFGMDAAILFSDILVVPHALGQGLEFLEGEGPKLDAIRSDSDLKMLDPARTDAVFEKIYAAVTETRGKLKTEGFNRTALIGFAGAPWTVACYMVQGGGSKDFAVVKDQIGEQWFSNLMDILIEATARYLNGQIEAGAEAIQIFDSWAGLLNEKEFDDLVIAPSRKIVQAVRLEHPDIPIIGFPRGAGERYRRYVEKTGVNAVSVDQGQSPQWMKDELQNICVVQGNLDPEMLLKGGDELKKAAMDILDVLSDGPFVFNLGHGVIKETPPEHVAQLAGIIREYKR